MRSVASDLGAGANAGIAHAARSDSFEMINIRNELRELRRERRDIKRILAYAPDDEDANEDMDEVQDDINKLEGRKCFLQARNETECKKDE